MYLSIIYKSEILSKQMFYLFFIMAYWIIYTKCYYISKLSNKCLEFFLVCSIRYYWLRNYMLYIKNANSDLYYILVSIPQDGFFFSFFFKKKMLLLTRKIDLQN